MPEALQTRKTSEKIGRINQADDLIEHQPVAQPGCFQKFSDGDRVSKSGCLKENAIRLHIIN